MPGDSNGLTRFRANPRTVRIGVRRDGDVWIATITSKGLRDASFSWTGRHKYAYRAVVLALRSAHNSGLTGIDLGMEWSYFHPFSTPEQRARLEGELGRHV